MTAFFATYGSLMIAIMTAAMLALSLYLPLMTGQLSLASPGFYSIGGYTAAVLSRYILPSTHYIFREMVYGKDVTQIFPSALLNGLFTYQPVVERGLYPLLFVGFEMIVAVGLCVALAAIVGFLSLRLRGIYFALATIAFVQIIAIAPLPLDFTGGAVGINNIPQPFNTAIGYAWITLPLLLVSMLFVFRLEHIRIGRAFTAIREDELAAEAMGINLLYHKLLAFLMGAILAGVTGVIYAHVLNTWNANQGTFDLSIFILAYVLVGGSRTFLGPVVGAIALTVLPELLRAIAGINGIPPWLGKFLLDGRLIIFGLLIALGTLFFPQGLLTPELFRRRRAGRMGDAP
jgi:branched-chain amino acid transport system permease protein